MRGGGYILSWKSFLFLVGTTFLFLILFIMYKEDSLQTSGPIHIKTRTLIIDAGHGGEDGGAVSLSGALESHINLAIAKRLDGVLGLYGVRTVLLREEDISLHSKEAQSLRQKKNSDLHNRVNLVNGQDDAVLLSIHQNSYPDKRYSGAQVFYAPTEGSREMAQIMQETLRAALNSDNNRLEKQIPDTIYLMNHITCPGMLVECGFLTHPQEEQLLQSVGYQTKLAVALAGGYLRSNTYEERET